MTEILNEYLTKKSSVLYLSKKYNLSYDKLYRFLKLNTKIISNRDRYSKANTSLFNEISSEEEAYWIGFLFADGNVYTKNGKSCISLSLIDMDHIDKFKSFIGVDNNIYKTSNGSYTYQFSSFEICQNLKKYGIVDQKSKNGIIETNFDSKYLIHFWRGVIDGDGWVLIKRFKSRNKIRIQPTIGICGTLDTCEKFINFLNKKNIKFNSKIRDHKSIKKIQFSDKVAISIIELLYKESNIHLNRKKDISTKILNNYGQRLDTL